MSPNWKYFIWLISIMVYAILAVTINYSHLNDTLFLKVLVSSNAVPENEYRKLLQHENERLLRKALGVNKHLLRLAEHLTTELLSVRNSLLDLTSSEAKTRKLLIELDEPALKTLIYGSDTNYWRDVNRLENVHTVFFNCTDVSNAGDCVYRMKRYNAETSPCKYDDRSTQTKPTKFNDGHCFTNINLTLQPLKQEEYYFDSRKVPTLFAHVIQNGAVDIYGNVKSGRSIITPCACHYNMMDVKGTAEKFRHAEVSVEEVFVISQFWGWGYFHFTVENIPRLAMYLNFLKLNSHIKIHVSIKKDIKLPWKDNKLPHFMEQFLQVLGINADRLVTGNIFARIVYLPQGTQCGQIHQPSGVVLISYLHIYSKAVVDAFEHRTKKWISTIRNKQTSHSAAGETRTENGSLPRNSTIQDTETIKLADDVKQTGTNRRNLILIKRSTRRWLKDHMYIASSLKKKAAKYALNFIVFNDANLPSINETMLLFHNAVLILSPHGAGLSNMIFSRPNTFIVEVLCSIESLGIYQGLAQSLGMHYYGLYATDYSQENGRCGEMTVDLEDLFSVIDLYLDHIDVN